MSCSGDPKTSFICISARASCGHIKCNEAVRIFPCSVSRYEFLHCIHLNPRGRQIVKAQIGLELDEVEADLALQNEIYLLLRRYSPHEALPGMYSPRGRSVRISTSGGNFNFRNATLNAPQTTLRLPAVAVDCLISISPRRLFMRTPRTCCGDSRCPHSAVQASMIPRNISR